MSKFLDNTGFSHFWTRAKNTFASKTDLDGKQDKLNAGPGIGISGNTISAAFPVGSNAGGHNSIFRGKYLGDAVTEAQYAAIQAGTFDDLFIGDYWTINSVNYRIAAFDYFLRTGNPECTTHHAVIVPDSYLVTAKMYNSSTTEGGYVGSVIYTEKLPAVKETITAAFGTHLLMHKLYLVNKVTGGKNAAAAWYDSEVDLMCEQMVFGSSIFAPVSDGTTAPTNHRVEKGQLPLFALAPEFITIRFPWWLRDAVTTRFFVFINLTGDAACHNAAGIRGVRPFFAIC